MYHLARTSSESVVCQGGAIAPLLLTGKISLVRNCTRGQKRKASFTSSQQQHVYTALPPQIRKVFVHRPQHGSISRARQSSSSQFYRSDFANQPFTGSYEPGLPTKGPLGSASNYGATKSIPRILKKHLDEFVVGQEQAKKVLSLAVHNHYLRVREIQRREEEEVELLNRLQRESHPVEGLYFKFER